MSKVVTKSVKSVSAKSVKSTNPYRPNGSYWTVVEVLAKYKGKMIPAATFCKAFPGVMGAEAFKAFKSKDKRNDETGKDCEGRMIQNAIVVNRPDYGAPLRELGLEVRKARTADGYTFGLFAIKAQPRKEIVRESREVKAATPKGKANKSAKSGKVKAAKAVKMIPTGGKRIPTVAK